MDNTEYIENYFKGNHSSEQKQQFEKKIMEDASFADEVAFYISANTLIEQQVKEEKKQRFRELYDQQKVVPLTRPVKTMWRSIAAASVIFAVVLGTFFLFGNRTSPQQLAEGYIQQNWQTLGVTMGSQDSLETGKGLFNSGKLAEALKIFESLAKNDPANANAKRYAGIVSLRMQNYDKAVEYFSKLEADTSRYSNPGKFYKAVALLKRNKIGDKEAAKLLLREVAAKDLEGKSEAVQWLEKL